MSTPNNEAEASNLSGKKSQETKPKTEKPIKVDYSASNGFLSFLNTHNLAICATSYQSGRLYLIGRNPKGGIMVNEEMFQKAMGLFVQDQTILLATLAHIYTMKDVLRPEQYINDQFTECFVPRTAHLTGVLDAHDVGMGSDGTIYFVNTSHNCIATVSDTHSFTPWWKPPFISQIVAEDRCHLNGMAMEDGTPRYATAVSRSDTIDGWRDRRSDGGVVIDIATNEVICEGLSMPHSPRVHNGKIWLLNSGTGELGYVDRGEKKSQGVFKPVVFCPGFVRGLSFHGKFAFIGLSRPRYQRFEGLALDQKLKDADSEAWCGIQIVDLDTGRCVDWFRIDGDIGELYDVAVLPNAICPKTLGPTTKDVLGLITIGDTPG